MADMSVALLPADLDENFAVPASSPESLRRQSLTAPLITDHDDTNDSSLVEEEYDSITDSGTEDTFEVRSATLKAAPSTRSSISSFPASVVHNDPYHDHDLDGLRTPSKSDFLHSYQNEPARSPAIDKRSPGFGYISGFRNPSSVRAMQMCESEYDETENITPNRRKLSRFSQYSHRSSNSLHSSPTKRSSRSNTPHRRLDSSSKLKKEFPLVLLHCTLLPPAVTSYGPLVADDVLEAVLPEEYRKRWRTLQDKVSKNFEVKQRGVLIPHPREDYDLLEERLLECLELQRPRIRQSHYLGGNDADSGFESASSHTDSTSSDAEDDVLSSLGHKCPDCGKHVTLNDAEQQRKWEVKVYAANGLMRGGAWTAAWSEMEKVDVEVGVWMPEEVRREVESRLAALQQKQEEFETSQDELSRVKEQSPNGRKISGERSRAYEHDDERMKEIYGGFQGRRQEEIDGLDDTPSKYSAPRPQVPEETDIRDFATTYTQKQQHNTNLQQAQPDLFVLIKRRFQFLLQDQKNIAIVLLSVLVLFFAISSAPKNATTSTATPVAVSTTSASLLTTTVDSSIHNIATPSVSTTYTESVIAVSAETEATAVESASPVQQETDTQHMDEDLVAKATQQDVPVSSLFEHTSTTEQISSSASSSPSTSSSQTDEEVEFEASTQIKLASVETTTVYTPLFSQAEIVQDTSVQDEELDEQIPISPDQEKTMLNDPF